MAGGGPGHQGGSKPRDGEGSISGAIGSGGIGSGGIGSGIGSARGSVPGSGSKDGSKEGSQIGSKTRFRFDHTVSGTDLAGDDSIGQLRSQKALRKRHGSGSREVSGSIENIDEEDMESQYS